MTDLARVKEHLIDDYIDANINDMDTQTLKQIVAETMYETLQAYTYVDLYAEIEEYYPHLLEN
jgi:hypothetical protein